MKNIFLILALFFIIPNQMQGNFKDTESKATIQITSDLLICKSSLKHKADKWQVEHVRQIKVGLTKFQFIPFAGMSLTIEIIKYE